MVLFVMAFVALSVWAVVVDTLGPAIGHGTPLMSTACFILTCIFSVEVGAPFCLAKQKIFTLSPCNLSADLHVYAGSAAIS